jgi:hypothetical protein
MLFSLAKRRIALQKIDELVDENTNLIVVLATQSVTEKFNTRLKHALVNKHKNEMETLVIEEAIKLNNLTTHYDKEGQALKAQLADSK